MDTLERARLEDEYEQQASKPGGFERIIFGIAIDQRVIKEEVGKVKKGIRANNRRDNKRYERFIDHCQTEVSKAHPRKSRNGNGGEKKFLGVSSRVWIYFVIAIVSGFGVGGTTLSQVLGGG